MKLINVERRKYKMNFNVHSHPYALSRNTVVAKHGMVATSNPLASNVGLQMLQKGGNAVDAAIATAAALTIVEPTSNGIGGDCFAIVYINGELHGMNASGKSPELFTMEAVKEKHPGISVMPWFGWTPITVPGVPKGWAKLNERFGRLSLLECLQPAIELALSGYPVGENLAELWSVASRRYLEESKNSSEFDEWKRTFLFDGHTPTFGQLITLPNHAETLRKIAQSHSDAFYYGDLADAIHNSSLKHQGFIRKKDLEAFEVEWVDPVSINYRGYDIYELPPNGQGIVSLMALSILKNEKFTYKDESNTLHKQIEAMKWAFADGMKHITDPLYMKEKVSDLIGDAYGLSRYVKITDVATIPEPFDIPNGGTVYLATADKWGNMVSYIQSNYSGFGSGVVIEDTGIAMQNRGRDFSLDATHVNCLAPLKKTYHTIVPGFIMEKNCAIGPFGVMGGYMQPQGHLQVVMNMIDFKLNPQMALDSPRWQWKSNNLVIVEQDFPAHLIVELIQKGHQIVIEQNRNIFGRGQIIIRMKNGVYVGGCESRTESNIACY